MTTKICCVSTNYGHGVDDWSYDQAYRFAAGETDYLVFCKEHNPSKDEIYTIMRSELPDEVKNEPSMCAWWLYNHYKPSTK